MIIQIDATTVADTLALADSYAYLNVQSDNQYSPEEVLNMINQESRGEPAYPNLYNYYIAKYDYYFETLTNHAL